MCNEIFSVIAVDSNRYEVHVDGRYLTHFDKDYEALALKKQLESLPEDIVGNVINRNT